MSHPMGMQTDKGKEMLKQVRRICGALPEVTELIDGHGHTTFKVKDKSFLLMSDYGMTFKSDLETQEVLVQDGRFHRPPYIGHRGWVGIHEPKDWAEMATLLKEAYLRAAPKRLVKQVLEAE
ncbi:YjbR protein [Paenibacillus taihuensis]|uniref:YjbR protein n=1 Tax=Paenibacillus taihuensis TaxID=1156355 RepID=A0A3D9RM83_9BACL|nr:MmcQ/YjbR family DNA-binding protein [Paenibacillus taihuensis]REE80993.1 YjbR protein [Paenibacillus taihuensis]